jgi:hypothetical protein
LPPDTDPGFDGELLGLAKGVSITRARLTTKTASNHVANILGKLGASNRGEAAAAAFTLDLVTPTAAPSS